MQNRNKVGSKKQVMTQEEKSVKIYTVTYHHSHNYGAMLQAYALQNTLRELGYDNKIIDYSEHMPSLFKKVTLSLRKENLVNLRYNLKIILNYKKFSRGYKRFEKFYTENLLKTQRYQRYDELETIECDLLLAGSDQLWNWKNKSHISDYYTLQFGNCHKVTYAISMGGYFGFSANIAEQFYSCLKQFCYISARETDIVQYLNKNKITVPSAVHIDPVFLLSKEQWSRLADESEIVYPSENYILVYELVPSPIITIMIKRIKQKYNLKVIVVAPTGYSKLKGDDIIRDAGPKELLKLIQKASWVLTTSFHGIAFSILFQKHFYGILSDHAPERIVNLLRMFHMEDKAIRSGNEELNDLFDYSYSQQIIQKEKEKSLEYLKCLKKL